MHLESRIILLCSEISSHNRVIVGTVPLFTCCIQLKNFDNRKHLSVLLIDVKTDKEQEPCMEFLVLPTGEAAGGSSCTRRRQMAGQKTQECICN